MPRQKPPSSVWGAFENAMDALQLATALETSTQAIVPAETSADYKDILYLASGDRLTGSVLSPTIPMETSYSTLDLEPDKIKQITVDGEGNASVVMVAGDVLAGTFATPKLVFMLDAANAQIEVETSKLASVAFNINTRTPEPLVDSLPDTALTASSYWGNDERHAPQNAQFRDTETFSNWSAANNSSTNEWLQIDLGIERLIVAIGTKGRVLNSQQWVTSYGLCYSLDGSNWTTYQSKGANFIFTGNTDINTEARHNLDVPIIARYVRFHPFTWNSRPTMRVEVYGVK
jgi:hypothetical protein